MEQQTYTQDQVNVMCKSYEVEHSKLLSVKASIELHKYNLVKSNQLLSTKNAELSKQIEELKKPKEVIKKKK